MKWFNLIIMVLTFFSSVNIHAQDQYYSGSYSIQYTELKVKDDSIYVRMKIVPNHFYVKHNKSISFVPCLSDGTHQLFLPHVTVKGKNEYNAYKRQLALASKQERTILTKQVYSVIKSEKKKDDESIEYQYAVSLEPWMEQASLHVFEDICGCGDAANRIRTWNNLATVEQLRIEEAIVPEVKKEVENTVDLLVASVDSMKYIFVDFKVNRSNLDTTYMSNTSELTKIKELIARVRKEPELRIKSIQITGFASPEGPFALNQKLSIARAQTFVNYLSKELDLSQSLFTVDAKDENWDGVKAFVESSDLDNKTEVLAILENKELSTEQRKHAIKQVDQGKFYTYILKEWYPHLRKVTCYINYERK